MNNLSEISKSLDNYVKGNITPKILDIAATEWDKTIRMNFDAGGRPVPWPARKKISKKQRGRKILVISGALRNYNCTPDYSTLSIDAIPDPRARAYSQIQNEGGVIHIPAHTIKHRKKKDKQGKVRTVFAGSKHKKFTETQTKDYDVTIPARTHTNIPPQDFPRWQAAIKQGVNL